jgi:hypothetical protein
MPKLNGIQAIREIRTFISNLNAGSELQTGDEHDRVFIKEPCFVMQTAYFTNHFKKYITNEMMVSSIFEKPITLDVLKSILSRVEEQEIKTPLPPAE